MVRLSDTPEGLRQRLEQLECPRFETTAWAPGPALSACRVVVISTAGLQKRGDRPFGIGASDYRVIPGDTPAGEIVMSHISTNFDRSGFQQDVNVVFPLERLRELARAGVIGSVADYHYSFMGATAPEEMASTIEHLAPLLHADGVTAALLVPV